MQNITIGRYEPTEPDATSITQGYAGWIEGTRDNGTTWIMYLDAAGGPQVFWGRRDPDRGVIGDSITLTALPHA